MSGRIHLWNYLVLQFDRGILYSLSQIVEHLGLYFVSVLFCESSNLSRSKTKRFGLSPKIVWEAPDLTKDWHAFPVEGHTFSVAALQLCCCNI